MCTDNYTKYVHHKYPYLIIPKYYNNNAINNSRKNYPYNANNKVNIEVPVQQKMIIDKKPVPQYLKTTPNTVKTYNNGGHEKNLTAGINIGPPGSVIERQISPEETATETRNLSVSNDENKSAQDYIVKSNEKNIAENINNPLRQEDNQQFPEEKIIAETQNLIGCDTKNEPESDFICDEKEICVSADINTGKRLTQEEIIEEIRNLFTNETENKSDKYLKNINTGKDCLKTDISHALENILPPQYSEYNTNHISSEKSITEQLINILNVLKRNKKNRCGLLYYRNWWERLKVDISIYGKFITGIPIFIEENTLRVINNNYSYFIPLEKIDYIRTPDGLRSSFDLSDDKPQKSDKK